MSVVMLFAGVLVVCGFVQADDIPLGGISDNVTPFSVANPITFSALDWSIGYVGGSAWDGYLAFYGDAAGTNVIAKSTVIDPPAYGCNGLCDAMQGAGPHGQLVFSSPVTFIPSQTYYGQFIRTFHFLDQNPQLLVGLHPEGIGYNVNTPPYDGNSVFAPISAPIDAGSPSPLILANLSNNVYSGATPGYGGYTSITTNCATVPSQCSYDGFRAVAFATGDKSHVVIAFLGTRPGSSGIGVKNVLADASFVTNVPSANLAKSISYAAQFVQALNQEYPGAKITLTGHSLGGAIAQLVGKASGLSTVVFNAPGGGLLYNQLTSQLAPAVGLGNGAINGNYRLYGEQISLAGTPIGSTVTLPDPSGTSFALGPDPAENVVNNWGTILDLHDMQTVINQINAQPIAAAGEPNLLSGLEQMISATAILSGGVGLDLAFDFTVADTLTTYLPDPSGGTDFTFIEQSGSPYFASVDLPTITGVSSYNFRYEIGTTWFPYQLFLPGEQYFLPSAVDGIQFDPLDASGKSVVAPEFLFGLTYASTGTFSGTLTEVQPTPEPASFYLLGAAAAIALVSHLRKKAPKKHSHGIEFN